MCCCKHATTEGGFCGRGLRSRCSIDAACSLLQHRASACVSFKHAWPSSGPSGHRNMARDEVGKRSNGGTGVPAAGQGVAVGCE
eukprot:171297-Prymnesium_polylepis.1